jgi:hypothetical protein
MIFDVFLHFRDWFLTQLFNKRKQTVMERVLPNKQTVHDNSLNKLIIAVFPDLRVFENPLFVNCRTVGNELTVKFQIQVHLVLNLLALLLTVWSHMVEFLTVLHLKHHHKGILDNSNWMVRLVELPNQDVGNSLPVPAH